MATTLKGFLKQTWQPLKNSVRFGATINTKRDTPPHFTRAKVEELCKPFYPKAVDPSVTLAELCQGPGMKKIEEENPYELLLAQEALSHFRSNKYVFYFHQNSMRKIDFLELQVSLKKCGVKIHCYGLHTLKYSLVGTIYEPTLILFQSRTLLGFGNEVNLSAMLKHLKRSRLVLLAGIIEDRLLNVSELEKYSDLPDLQTMRASLVSVLNSAAGGIVQKMNHHPQTLVGHISQYEKQSNLSSQ